MGEIDIVIPWVDGQDMRWINEKNEYLQKAGRLQKDCANDGRYRPNIDLKYWFRSIEKCMPWIRYIFFVTYGQIPEFLNVNHPKLRIVQHKDYIPEEYLPTFNSNTIEMNLFRITELSENFILFNDDVLPLEYFNEEYFFKNGLACDEAVERIFAPKMNENLINSVTYCQLNNMAIINKHFDKRTVQKKFFKKWFNLKYGKDIWRNIFLAYYYDFDMFTNWHLANSMKKSTFKKVWDIEPELCDQASKNKFRNYSDISQYLVRAWQLCEGEFFPRKTKGKNYILSDENYKSIADDIKRKKYAMICLNDSPFIEKYEEVKRYIEEVLDSIFPEKCSFEK